MDQTKIILHVEDNDDDAELAKRALKKCNFEYEIVHVNDGAKALQWLFGSVEINCPPTHVLPAMILLDLKLPKLNGIEVLKRIRQNQRTKLVPVVILTSSAEEEDIVNSYAFGCNSYIRKPIDFSQFNDAVIRTGMYWLLLNEPPIPAEVVNVRTSKNTLV